MHVHFKVLDRLELLKIIGTFSLVIQLLPAGFVQSAMCDN